MTYGRTGFGHSLSRSEEIKLSEEAEKSAVNIVRDFYAMKPEEMMRFLDSSCPKCKERNKWIPIPRKTSIGFVMFALDILLFLVFIYVTLMWRWNAALCLAFIILLNVGVIAWRIISYIKGEKERKAIIILFEIFKQYFFGFALWVIHIINKEIRKIAGYYPARMF